MSASEQTTDPARELYLLAERLATHKKQPGTLTILSVLSAVVGIPADDPNFSEVLTGIRRRIADLIKLAEKASHEDFSEEMRKRVLPACRALGEIFHPARANSNWEPHRAQDLSEANRQAILFFSQTARRHKLLRLVSDSERNAALSRLAEARDVVASDGDLEEWEKSVLASGLDRIELVLRHLFFFGHDAAIANLLLVHTEFLVVEPRDAAALKRPGVLASLHTVALAAHLLFFFCQPTCITACRSIEMGR